MKTPDSELEELLRAAPQPQAPAGLRERLVEDIRLSKSAKAGRSRHDLGSRGWLAQWWPVLTTACLTLASAVVFAMQHAEVAAASHNNGATVSTEARDGNSGTIPISADPGEAGAAAGEAPDERVEIEQLREEVARLKQEIAGLEGLVQENQRLRTDLAAQTNSAPEYAAVAEAAARAKTIQCINNLKQLGLAVRIWAVDHGEHLPPDFQAMTNEMANPRILVCPADNSHTVANGWDSFTAANITYEYLAANAPETEPNRVAFRCPIHGNVGLCDGSAQMEVTKNRPASLVWRDGKLYLE